ncbi:NAD(P)-dependent oxidoreductase [uncultured Bradyrhizobium sp.]|jgi:nucleoside-diphosphate-sugar epimerase|uniref:NAD-dependent epimerase/dehydratase family protein n=1 Tax=uncultured Bradyrhizobium sp. TaxID=199684 RepID=UPI00261748BF|nr:NAD(P)-dependent oxidoreductase [uncultured Bradyrhizobium sp.]
MRILVTGANGFIGAAVVRQAVRDGHEVIAVLRPEGNSQRLDTLLSQITVLRLDLRNFGAVAAAIENSSPNALIHCAWAGVNQKLRMDNIQYSDNLGSACNLVESLARRGSSKFVGIGSQAEYGLLAGPIAETDLPRPTTLYGASKLATCILTDQLARQFNLPFAWMRVFSAYGPDDNPHWLIPSLIDQMLRGERPKTTAGEQRWDYLFIDDLARAVLKVACQSDAQGVFNLGSGIPVQVRTLIEKLREIASPNLEVGFGEIPYRSDQIWHMQANISRLSSTTGWKPTISIDDGLAMTVDWRRRSKNAATINAA